MLSLAMLMMNTTGGSNRLNVYNPLRKLAEMDKGYTATLELVELVPGTDDIRISKEEIHRIASTYDVIVVSKVLGKSVIELTRLARSMGHVVIYVVSDIYSRLEMFYEANASVVGSRFMQCLLKSHLRLTNIYWLEDTVESPQELRKDVYTTDKDLSAVWFGCCNENYRFAKAVEKSILSTSGWRFTYITGPGGEPGDVPYSVDTVYQEIIKHDVVYIPTAITLIGQCKSAGRAIFAQQLAMPVITGSIYSYVRHIDPFVTGLVCYIDDDWRQNFNMLKQPEYREYLGNNARESVKDRFTAEVHAVKWRNIIEEVLCLRETR